MAKITFRVDDDLADWLDEYTDDTDYSKSEVMRSHLESMRDDEFYREFHERCMDEDYEHLAEFLESSDEVDSDWINLDKVDYDEMFDKFKSIKHTAEEGGIDEAYEMVEALGEEGFEREEILMHSIVAKYDK